MNFGSTIQPITDINIAYVCSVRVCTAVCKMCRAFVNAKGDVRKVHGKLIAFAFGLENSFWR